MSLRDTAIRLLDKYNDSAEVIAYVIVKDPVSGGQSRTPDLAPIVGKVTQVEKALVDDSAIKSSDMMFITYEQTIDQSSRIRFGTIDHEIIKVIPVYLRGEIVINKVVIRG